MFTLLDAVWQIIVFIMLFGAFGILAIFLLAGLVLSMHQTSIWFNNIRNGRK